MSEQTKPKKMLPTRALCQRFGIVDRTVDRWVAAGVLPLPTWLNGRRYWPEAEIEKVERAAVGAKPTSGSQATRFKSTTAENATT